MTPIYIVQFSGICIAAHIILFVQLQSDPHMIFQVINYKRNVVLYLAKSGICTECWYSTLNIAKQLTVFVVHQNQEE